MREREFNIFREKKRERERLKSRDSSKKRNKRPIFQQQQLNT